MAVVEYTGFFHDPTGFGSAAILHAQALSTRVGVQIRSIRLTRDGVGASHPRVRIPSSPGVTSAALLHVPPQHLPQVSTPSGLPRVGIVAWETEQLPATLAHAVESIDELWVPSEFSARAFRATGKPVHVICHPLAARWVARRSFPGIPDDIFLFTSIFEWSDRKNPLGLLKAFVAAFPRGDVGLLLKIGIRFGADPQRVLQMVSDAWRGRLFRSRAPLWLIVEDVSDETIERMFARTDAYVSLHRAEGFGLCLAHAMARGRPVVATDYSGNLEFMDASSAFLVDWRPTKIAQSLAPYRYFEPGMVWAEPALDSAVEQLRACVDRPSVRRARAGCGFDRVSRQLAPARIADQMAAALPA